MSATYNYSIQNAFPNHKVSPDRLTLQIQQSTIVTALDNITTVGDNCAITFKASLSVGDKTTLDGIVAAHSGEPLPEAPELVKVAGLSIDENGKTVTSVYPATIGWKTWFASRGDKKTAPQERAGGQPIYVSFDAAELRGVKEIALDFVEPIELHDGQAYYGPEGAWTPQDYVSLGAKIPATATTPNAGGTGNCNRAPTGLGFDLIVPAAGNGAYDVNLATACPVPTAAGATPSGYWNVARDTGVVTASATPGAAEWNLITSEVQVWPVRNVALGNPLRVWDIDTYLTEYIHPNWQVIVRVEKQSTGAGWLAGWLGMFRLKTTTAV